LHTIARDTTLKYTVLFLKELRNKDKRDELTFITFIWFSPPESKIPNADLTKRREKSSTVIHSMTR
jgi:hypothetical protein